ncbi:MAG: glucose-1-phosphate adenylyltransferase [Gammaproteobacteria bacterium RBG_16_51_14]|nr:MAG: glucose-1-phosphate adenylyltransferase [Gammaproteobacteria bacterium RBG_16_51_14]
MTIQHDRRSVDRLIHETLAVVMAGGRGTRLYQLTARHSKPAIPFGGKYRIIDFTLSNCLNSGINKICILTQYHAHSLIQHLERGWSFYRYELGEFIELLPAQERFETSSWYLGTADAVYQNFDIILDHRPSYILILGGDHIYKMDYGMLMASHIENNADVTVGCIEVPLSEASDFGLMLVDESSRVIGFQEKPARPEPMPGQSDTALASMGIYLFTTEFLVKVLEDDAKDTSSNHDFGKDIMPAIHKEHRLFACPFNDLQSGEKGYWRDVGTVDAFWEANLELIGVTPPLNLYEQDWPVRTFHPQLPPAKFVFDDDGRRGMAVDSMVSAGCIISGAIVRHSLLSSDVRINDYSLIEDSVLLPGVRIGSNCIIKRAIIDSHCNIPDGTIIGINPDEDRKRFHVTPKGVVLVCPEML